MMTEKKMQLVDCEYSSREGTLASRVSMPSRPLFGVSFIQY